MSLYEFTATLIDGTPKPLADYRGHALLVVNTASRCGFTPQYKGLQALHDRFAAQGFAVLAFPCDQFGHQEPGSNAEIAAFCERSFAVSFPVFAKIEVNGPGAHPLWAWLKRQKGGLLGGTIPWNFTKFLIDRQGRVQARHASLKTPESLAPEVARLVAA